jgi:hypothetical protein
MIVSDHFPVVGMDEIEDGTAQKFLLSATRESTEPGIGEFDPSLLDDGNALSSPPDNEPEFVQFPLQDAIGWMRR